MCNLSPSLIRVFSPGLARPLNAIPKISFKFVKEMITKALLLCIILLLNAYLILYVQKFINIVTFIVEYKHLFTMKKSYSALEAYNELINEALLNATSLSTVSCVVQYRYAERCTHTLWLMLFFIKQQNCTVVCILQQHCNAPGTVHFSYLNK